MHVLVIPSFYPDESNILNGIFVREQVRSLSDEVSKISIIYAEQRSLRKFNLTNLRSSYFQFHCIKDDNWNEIRVKGWNLPTILGKRIWIHNNLRLFKKYIKIFGKPDLIHAHNIFNSGFVASSISKKYNIPFVITEHDSGFLMNSFTKYKLDTASNIYKNASKVLAVSNSLKLVLERITPNLKVNVVPNIINPMFFKKPKRDKKIKDRCPIKFIAIGNLNKNKGHILLINSFLIISNENITLEIIGEGPERDNILRKINELGLQNKIKLLGKLKPEDIYNNLIDSDCLVHASSYETFGVVLIEALATGLPFISTKSGGPEDIFENGFGYLVEKNKVNKLSEAMLTFLQNKDTFNKSIIRKRAFKKYSPKSISLNLKNIYHSVIN